MYDQLFPSNDVSTALLRYHLHLKPSGNRPPIHVQDGDAQGVLGFARNPLDPEAPLVLMLTNHLRLVPALLQAALLPSSRYTFIVNADCRSTLKAHLRDIEYERNCLVYTCDQLVTTRKLDEVKRYNLADSRFGYTRLVDGVKASDARVNWLTEGFAELGVHTKKEFRGRGYAKDAVAALTSEILAGGRKPVYVVGRKNLASIAVCEALGYTLSSYGEYECVARYAGSQRRQQQAFRPSKVIRSDGRKQQA